MFWRIAVTVVIIICCAYKYYKRRRYNKKVSETFEDRHVFITGCDAGFGYDLAVRLDLLGFHVYAGCQTNVGEEELKRETTSKVTTMRIDVRNGDSIKNAVQTVTDMLPEDTGLWGLVNNAGIYGNISHTEWLSKQDYEDILDVNLYGTIEVTRMFLPLLRKERGRIINMSSIMGRFAYGCVPYAVASHAIEAYSDRLRQDLYHIGVTVHIMEPGFFRTDLFDFDDLIAQYRESWGNLTDERKEYYGKTYGNAYGERVLHVIESVSDLNYDVMSDTYEHALTAKYPKPRYVIGKDANRVFLPLSWVPESWSDYFLKMREGLPAALIYETCDGSKSYVETDNGDCKDKCTSSTDDVQKENGDCNGCQVNNQQSTCSVEKGKVE